jgi:hypothetical protein
VNLWSVDGLDWAWVASCFRLNSSRDSSCRRDDNTPSVICVILVQLLFQLDALKWKNLPRPVNWKKEGLPTSCDFWGNWRLFCSRTHFRLLTQWTTDSMLFSICPKDFLFSTSIWHSKIAGSRLSIRVGYTHSIISHGAFISVVMLHWLLL